MCFFNEVVLCCSVIVASLSASIANILFDQTLVVVVCCLVVGHLSISAEIATCYRHVVGSASCLGSRWVLR